MYRQKLCSNPPFSLLYKYIYGERSNAPPPSYLALEHGLSIGFLRVVVHDKDSWLHVGAFLGTLHLDVGSHVAWNMIGNIVVEWFTWRLGSMDNVEVVFIVVSRL